jgi:hypothetical protein
MDGAHPATAQAREGEGLVRVEDREVFIKTRTVTQTVNICTEQNQRGWYEHVFRLDRERFVTAADVGALPTLHALKDWLLARGAIAEGARAGGPSRARVPRVVPVPTPVDGDPWLEDAARIVDIAIDSLVWEFVEHPTCTVRSTHCTRACSAYSSRILSSPTSFRSATRGGTRSRFTRNGRRRSRASSRTAVVGTSTWPS